MYLTRFEVMVPPGSTGDYEGFVGKISEFRKGKPGVIGQTLLRSYAYPGKYVLISRWETVEAAWDLQKTDAYREVLKGAPGGAGQGGGRPTEGYEDVFNVDADDFPNVQANCEVLYDFELDLARKAPEFEKNRREFFELHKQHRAGFVTMRLRRSAGNPTKYLVISAWKDREATRGGAQVPEIQKFLAEHSSRQFLRTPQTIEAFAVIRR